MIGHCNCTPNINPSHICVESLGKFCLPSWLNFLFPPSATACWSADPLHPCHADLPLSPAASEIRKLEMFLLVVPPPLSSWPLYIYIYSLKINMEIFKTGWFFCRYFAINLWNEICSKHPKRTPPKNTGIFPMDVVSGDLDGFWAPTKLIRCHSRSHLPGCSETKSKFAPENQWLEIWRWPLLFGARPLSRSYGYATFEKGIWREATIKSFPANTHSPDCTAGWSRRK